MCYHKKSKETICFYGRTRTKFRCGLTQITRNKGQGVLAQITKDNFFYEMTRTKTWCGQAQITINRETTTTSTPPVNYNSYGQEGGP